MASILIKNGRVWDGERFLHADILADGGVIAKTEPSIKAVADFVYDADGKTVSAGLVDAHVHMRGISSEEFGIHAEMSCIPFGVTAAADAGARRGNRVLLDSFQLKNGVFVGVEIKNNRAMLERVETLLSEYGDRAFGLKVYFDVGVSEVLDATPLREVCAFARERNLRVMVHCSNSPIQMAELSEELRAGDILTHAFHGGASSAAEDGFESLLRAQKRGVVIDVGFAGNVHTDFSVLRGAIERGLIPDLLSTDVTRYSAYMRGGRYGMTMCMNIAKTLGMCEEDIFRAVTSNPAKALGKEKEWGCLRVGRAADIAVLDYTDEGFDLTDRAGNRVVSECGYRCALTLLDGQILYRR